MITPSKKVEDYYQIENFVSPVPQGWSNSKLSDSESNQKKNKLQTIIKTPDKVNELIENAKGIE